MILNIFENRSGKAHEAAERERLFLRCASEYCAAEFAEGVGVFGRGYADAHAVAGAGDSADAACGDGRATGSLAAPPKLGIGPHGKPYFAEPPLRGRVFFSISHSGRYWAVLFADSEVGLDIEDLSIRGRLTDDKITKIAERFFAEDERRYVAEGASSTESAPHNVIAGSDPQSTCQRAASRAISTAKSRFFRVWTAKESYIKYTGNGMSQGLASFSALNPPGGITVSIDSPVSGLIVSYCHAALGSGKIIPKQEIIQI